MKTSCIRIYYNFICFDTFYGRMVSNKVACIFQYNYPRQKKMKKKLSIFVVTLN